MVNEGIINLGNAKLISLDPNILISCSNDIKFLTSDTEKMRIDSSGNVGIGTDNPSTKLHVNGDTNIVGNLKINNSNISLNNLDDVTVSGTPSTGDFLKWSGSAWVADNHNTITSTNFNYTYSSFSGSENKWQNIASINLTPGKWLIMTHFASYANYDDPNSQIRNCICFRENSSEASGSASNLSGVIALQADIDNRNSDFILKRHNLYTVYTTTTNQTIYLSIEVASGYTLRVMGYENVTSALGSSRNDHKSEFFAIQL